MLNLDPLSPLASNEEVEDTASKPEVKLMKRLLMMVLLGAVVGCDDDPSAPIDKMDVGTDMPDMVEDTSPDLAPDIPAEDLDPDPNCDPLDPGHCALPWPSNRFLEPDETRATGYTVRFGETTLPANRMGVHINPEPYTRMDGYGLGSPAVALFPNVDSSSLPNEYRIEDSLAADAKILLFEVKNNVLVRVPYFVDHDDQTDDEAQRALIVRPAVILNPGSRYVVAFRNLETTEQVPIEPSRAFEALVKQTATGTLSERQERFNEVFGLLETAGVTRESLILAWDWNTASEQALHGVMLHMRDEAFAAVGPEGPPLTITNVEKFTVEENADVGMRIQGSFEAPHYIEVLENDAKLRFDENGLPKAEGTRTVAFWVNVPRSALSGDPHGLVMYGHGLFGLGSQTNGGFNTRIGNTHNLIFFGASLWGMADEQSTQAVNISLDLSRFGIIGDQLHQGMLEWLLLARAFKHQFGDLQEVADEGIVVNEELYYSGISQGGIFGPTFVALSPDVQYGHAGVPGHTYGTLLHRSVDFAPFFLVLKSAYPSVIDQLLGLNAIQMRWDGTDPVSYFRKISASPFDGQQNAMLWVPARGDFQVSVMQNELLTRTEGLGVALMENYDVDRDVALVDETPFPHQGSAVVLYDFAVEANGQEWRNAWPAPGNRTPTGGPDDACGIECPVGQRINGAPFECCDGACCFDPHSLGRNNDAHNQQMVHFFRNQGEVIDVCGGDGCTPN